MVLAKYGFVQLSLHVFLCAYSVQMNSVYVRYMRYLISSEMFDTHSSSSKMRIALLVFESRSLKFKFLSYCGKLKFCC